MADPQRVFVRTPRPGVTLERDGAIFCVVAAHASAVELCLFGTQDAPAGESRVSMMRLDGGHWAAFVPAAGPGTTYGYRAHGAWAPAAGLRHNPAKLLLDPYAGAVSAEMTWRPEVFGHVVDDAFAGDARVRDDRDSAPFVPRGVVVSHDFDWGGDARPQVRDADRVIYEAHVKGLTVQHPDVPEELRGTYAGLAHASMTTYLRDLGVTSVELLPVHAFVDEPHLVKLGLSNYWGYNTLGFFAPHAAYAHASDAQGVVDEVKSMVRSLHAAGLEVILDVVYNHTCEQGGHEGAMLSLRGLDNATAYRLGEHGEDIDVTGCGNTLDVREPAVMRLVLDSLRHWVSEYHVDGFRFDLAVALGRAPGDDFDPRAALLMAMQADPVLSQVTLIAEPWDIGLHGWRTGQFPAGFAEWNDRFRNTVRDFWLADLAAASRGDGGGGQHPGGGVADLATRLTGSQDLVGGPLRRPQASINYVTAHDGFTLADLTAYETKHNEANGEDNRDGTSDNRSWNHGVEGWPSDAVDESGGEPTSDAAAGSVSGGAGDVAADLAARRLRSMRNMLGTLLLSAGVPMLTAGDEFARTQHGNNNAYCQDSPIGWVDWNHSPAQRDLLATTRHLLALRRRFGVLRHPDFYPGSRAVAGEPDVRWFSAAGVGLSDAEWTCPSTRTLQALFDGGDTDDESVLLVLHGALDAASVTLPPSPDGGGWSVVWDSAQPAPLSGGRFVASGDTCAVDGPSMLVLTPSRG